jgi:MGT family glycosyltransferase
MGTVFNEDITMFETVLQGLESDDLTVVVTVGDQADGRRLDGHKNTHVERFVPQAELLPHCDLVITHGGAGTVLGALAFGVPLVVLPLGADHFDNAAGVVAAGAGIRILPQDVTAASIGAASRSVLSEPVFRAAATRVRDQIAAMPQPEVAARAVLRLARNTSTSN